MLLSYLRLYLTHLIIEMIQTRRQIFRCQKLIVESLNLITGRLKILSLIQFQNAVTSPQCFKDGYGTNLRARTPPCRAEELV